MSEQDRIVLATTNKGKVRELSSAFAKYRLTVVGLDAYPGYQSPVEDGATFAENALIKAVAAAKYTGCIAIADDSGLCVSALNDAPGIFSARYGDDIPMQDGENRDDRNIRKLLSALQSVPADKRQAAFHCAMVAVKPNGEKILAEGIWQGVILFERHGSHGFGYDPVFYDPVLKKAAAELTLEEKNAVSHRGCALRRLLLMWDDFMATGTTL